MLAMLGCATLAAGATPASGLPVGTILFEDTGKCTIDNPTGPHLGESCTTTLWTVHARTRWRRHLTPEPGGDQAAWSPDGRTIAFVAPPDGGLWLMRADGSGKRRLVPGESVSSPTWSPDGRRIAFVTGQGDDVIVIVDANGDRRRVLARFRPGIRELTWSPRGDALAFVGGQESIYLVDAGGGARRFLVSGRDPTWSGDGSRVAFVQSLDDLRGSTISSSVGVASVDAPDVRVLRGLTFDSDPTWAPGGRELAFVRRVDWDRSPVLYRIRPDGSGLRRVTAPADDPAWSPGRNWIAFDHDDGHVYVVRPDGSGRTKLVPGGGPLHWRPTAGKR